MKKYYKHSNTNKIYYAELSTSKHTLCTSYIIGDTPRKTATSLSTIVAIETDKLELFWLQSDDKLKLLKDSDVFIVRVVKIATKQATGEVSVNITVESKNSKRASGIGWVLITLLATAELL